MNTLLAFLFALAILIAVHEWGHFWVARRFGVKVLRFSLGFGPVLFSRRDRQGTEFSLSAIPLGGYVRFVDQRDPDYDPLLESVSYNSKPVWQRMAIVAAGPMANFLLAIALYAVINLQGISSLAPVVGVPVPASPLAEQGLTVESRLLSIDGESIGSWRQVSLSLANRLGTSGALELVWLDAQQQQQQTTLVLDKWLGRERDPDPLQALGLRTWQQAPPAILGDVVLGGAADLAGLQVGDRIVAVNDQPIEHWGELIQQLALLTQLDVELSVLRHGLQWPLPVRLQEQDGRLLLGVQLAVPDEVLNSRTIEQVGAVQAVKIATEDTLELIRMSLGFIVRMLSGNLSAQNLSGPVSIAQLAGESASYGWVAFLSFLAFISISLGIVNLLPLPVLDGGHLVLLAVEGVRGKPLPMRIEQGYAAVGTVLLLGLMSFAIINDLFRFFS